MTVICYRDGVMAADSQTTYNGRRLGSVRKIARSPDGNLGGCGGDSADCEAFRLWFSAGGPKESIPKLSNEDGDFDGMIVTADSRIFMIDGSLLPTPLETPFYAIGSGAPIAIGAMHMGATAEQAVGAAIAHSCYCDGPIQVEYLTLPVGCPDIDDIFTRAKGQHVGGILSQFTEELDRAYNGVLCIASAMAPTGETFVSIGKSMGDSDLPGVVQQGERRQVCSSAADAVRQFGVMFAVYASGRTGRLYWRARPELQRDDAAGGYVVYARCLISDMPVLDGVV